jgi:hypothetical protein
MAERHAAAVTGGHSESQQLQGHHPPQRPSPAHASILAKMRLPLPLLPLLQLQ